MFDITVTVDLSERLGEGASVDVIPIAWLPNEGAERATNLLSKMGNVNPQTGQFLSTNNEAAFKAMREIAKMCVSSWTIKNGEQELPIPKLMADDQLRSLPLYILNKIMGAAQEDSGEIPEENGEQS